LFVPDELRARAYEDSALPIGCDQTISQPFVVGFMSQLLDVRVGDRVLDVGTGSGYQAAVLAELGAEVFSVEILPELSLRAGKTLAAAGYGGVRLHVGDGADGWPRHAPYRGILVASAASEVPAPLIDQLAAGGRLVIPLEADDLTQWIWCLEKDAEGSVQRQRALAVRFVPMTGRAQQS
jgi:protein-L-isoaspartate(D-aspartate) O-methyltransferase